MITLRHILAVTLTVAAIGASATDFHLKNGSVISGYALAQPQSKDARWTIDATGAYLVLDSVSAPSYSNLRFIAEERLDPEDRDWAESTGTWHYDRNVRGLNIASVKTNDFSTPHAILLGEGHNTLRVRVNTPLTLKPLYTDIVKITETPRTPDILSGVNREYTLKDGRRVVGEFVEQILPQGAHVVRQASGIDYVVPFEDARNFVLVAINPDQPIEEQVEYLDVLTLKDGRQIVGVMLAMEYKDQKYTLTIKEPGRDYQPKVDADNVVSVSKRPNLDSNIKRDVLLNPGELRIGGKEVVRHFAIDEEKEYIYLTPTDSVLSGAVAIPRDTDMLTVHTKLEAGMLASDYCLVPVTELTMRLNSELNLGVARRVLSATAQKKLGLDDITLTTRKLISRLENVPVRLYGFSYKTLAQEDVPIIGTELSRNGTTTITFRMPRQGYYALYNKSAHTAVLIEVK